MAREKSPAFQFYTKDWDSDINVIPMTYEEEGVYFALIRLLWNHPKMTANLDDLRLFLKGKPRLSQMQIWWKTIGKCFTERDGCLFHKRVDRERRKQAAYRKSQSTKGKLGGRPKNREKAAAKPELVSGKALLSASSPSGSVPPKSPARAGDVRLVRGDWKHADAVLRSWLGWCRHEPKCASHALCRQRLAREYAEQRKAS